MVSIVTIRTISTLTRDVKTTRFAFVVKLKKHLNGVSGVNGLRVPKLVEEGYINEQGYLLKTLYI